MYQMTTCTYCGKENTQAGAAYCSYCGSSLLGSQQGVTSTPQPRQPFGSTPPTYPSSYGNYSYNASERYERALRRSEQLGRAVAILSVIALFLLVLAVA